MNETFAIAMAIGLIFGGLGCFLFNGGNDDTDDAWEE